VPKIQYGIENRKYKSLSYSYIQGGPKTVSHYQIINKIVLNRIEACMSMRLDLFVKLKYELSTIILFV